MSDIYVFSAKENDNDYSTMGLAGALTPTTATFKETLNGDSILTLEHPLDEFGAYLYLVEGNILVVPVPVMTTPEIQNGKCVTTVWTYKVKPLNQLTSKNQRTLYKKKSGSSRKKILKAGDVVTVVQKSEKENERWKVKSAYGQGWVNTNGDAGPDGFTLVTEHKIADNSKAIQEVQSPWTVTPQYFRIQTVKKSMDGYEVEARHISYDLLYNATIYESKTAVKLQDALDGILKGCVSTHEFSAHTNVENEQAGLFFRVRNPIDIFVNEDDGLCKRYDVCMVRDNYDLYFLHDPGLNRGVRIQYGKNMTGISFESSTDETATRIVPIGETKKGENLYLSDKAEERYIDSPKINNYAIPHVYELKCDNCKVGDSDDKGGKVTTAIARARMRAQAEKLFEDGCDDPKITMSVEFINLGDTEEYKDFKNLENCFLSDYVIVQHPYLNIDITARITEIEWDCLLDRMNKVTIGQVGKTLANTGITSWQIPSGISGSKIANETISGSALAENIINAKHVQSESINTEALQAGSVTAEKIAAEAITADKIKAGEIDAMSIAAITAKIKTLKAGDIQTDSLAAELARFTVLTAGTATFDKATVSHLVANLFNLTGSGVMDDVFIHNLKIAYAQMVSASIGNLVLQASNGEYYQIDVDQNGSVSATLVEPSEEEIANGVFGQTRPILATSMTVDDMNASSIKAVHMLINKIDAARIDVDQLFARQAFITQLTTSNIIGGKSLTIIAGESESAVNAAKNAVKTYRQEATPDIGDGVKNGDLWIKPSTGAIYQADAIKFVLDENGDLYLNHASGDGHSARFQSGDPTMLETSFAMTVTTDGEITAMPVTWMLVQDQTLANRIDSKATTKVDVEYALGDSNDTPPATNSTDWKTEAPEQEAGKYIWSRTVTTFGNGIKTMGVPVCISPSLGKNITSIEEQYALSGSAETAPEDGWQTSVPTPTSAKPYIWTRSKITYVDGTVIYAGTQVQAKHYADILKENLLDKTDGETTVYYQDTEPTGSGIQKGDLWYDTDSSSETIYRYNGSSWVANTSDTALTQALGALKRASTAKAIADSKIVTFAQDEAPTSGMSEGDLWIDTNDDNKLHRYELIGEGTYGWVEYADTSYEAKFEENKIYLGETPPTNPFDGKIWVDIGSPQNVMKRYTVDAESDSGEWVVVTDLQEINDIAAELKKQQAETQKQIGDLMTAITIDDRGLHVYKPKHQHQNEVIIDHDSLDVVVNGNVFSSFVAKGAIFGNYRLWQPEGAGGLAFSLM